MHTGQRAQVSPDLPLITIGITCYNAEDTIVRALESALSQGWPNIEIIVVDDCSSDRSLGLLESKASGNERVRVLSHEINRGCAAARNTIIENAKGEFVAFFDDDDVSLPQRLGKQHERIIAYEAHTGAQFVACYASGERRYPNGYALPLRAIGSEGIEPVGTVVVDYLLFFQREDGVFYGSGTPTCSLMARKTSFQAVGPFDTTLRRQEDVDFAIRLAFLGGHFIGSPEPLLIQHATQGNEKSAGTEHQSFLQIVEKNKSYLIEKKRYRYAIGWSKVRFYHFRGREFAAFLALCALAVRYPCKTALHFFKSAPKRLIHELKMSIGGK